MTKMCPSSPVNFGAGDNAELLFRECFKVRVTNISLPNFKVVQLQLCEKDNEPYTSKRDNTRIYTLCGSFIEMATCYYYSAIVPTVMFDYIDEVYGDLLVTGRRESCRLVSAIVKKHRIL